MATEVTEAGTETEVEAGTEPEAAEATEAETEATEAETEAIEAETEAATEAETEATEAETEATEAETEAIEAETEAATETEATEAETEATEAETETATEAETEATETEAAEKEAEWQPEEVSDVTVETDEKETQISTTDSVTEISTLIEFKEFARNAANSSYAGKYVRLTNDIKFDGTTVDNFDGISSFTGVFDGAGHTISGIIRTNGGIFSSNSGTIKNLTISGCELTQGLVSSNSGTVENCHVVNTSISLAEYNSRLGGIAGSNSGTIENCSVRNTTLTLSYKSSYNARNCYQGGIAGYNNYGTISNCMSEAEIIANNTSSVMWYVGGLVGYNYGTVQSSFYAGEMNTTSYTYSGAVIGVNSGIVNNCFCSEEMAETVGAIIYKDSGSYSKTKTYNDAMMRTQAFADTLNGLRGDNADWLGWELNSSSVYPVQKKAYRISLNASYNGAAITGTAIGVLTADTDYAPEGRAVSVTASIDEDYMISSISINSTQGAVAYSESNGTYAFTMPAGDVSVSAQIVYHKAISKCAVSLSATTFTYCGSGITPGITVTDGDKTLTEGADYTLSYSNNVNAGTAYVTVEGTGSYYGTAQSSYTIQKAEQAISYKSSYSKKCGDKEFTVKAKRTTGNGKLTYKSSNKSVATVSGSGKVKIKGSGIATITVKAASTANYNEKSIQIKVKVSPKKTSISSVKAVSGKKLEVKWKKSSQANGYQVQVATDKNFKKNVVSKKVNGTSTKSATIKNLKKGKRYYVRVRAYKTVYENGTKKTLYSSWSSVKRSSAIKK